MREEEGQGNEVVRASRRSHKAENEEEKQNEETMGREDVGRVVEGKVAGGGTKEGRGGD